MDEEMLRPFFCTQSLGPFVHPGAKLKGGCETKGGCKAATKPTLYTPMVIKKNCVFCTPRLLAKRCDLLFLNAASVLLAIY